MISKWRSRIATFVVAFALAMASALTPASAQSDMWAIYKRFEQFYAAGNYASALIEAQKYEAAVKAQFGTNHTNYAGALNNLAMVYNSQARHGDAVGLYQRALAIKEKALGASHPDVANPLIGLANVYQAQGKYGEAEGLYQRALAIKEKALGASHPDVADTLNNLAIVYQEQGKYGEAEGLFKRALAIREKALGASHPDVAATLNNLAVVYQAQGKYAEAVGLYQRALAIWEKALGASHPDVAMTLNNLAGVYKAQGKYAEAEGLYQRALAIKEKALGASHPDVALSLYSLALLYGAQGNSENALAFSRKAIAAVIAHGATEAPGAQQKERSGGLIEQRGGYFQNHVANLAAAARNRREPVIALGKEGLEIAQWAIQSSAAAAVQQMATRFASGGGALGTLLRESQDLSAAWHEHDKALLAALSKPEGQQDRAATEALRRQIADIDIDLAVVAARLEKEFPDYAALVSPKPLNADDIQKLIGSDEALVFFLTSDKETYVFVVTRGSFEWKTIPLGQTALAEKVQALRCGLDYEGEWKTKERKLNCLRLVKPSSAPSKFDPLPFDLSAANELYEILFGPFKGMIKDKRLLVVTTGPLTSLPLHTLVTEKPKTAFPANLNYRGVPWLGQRHAITVLPSVASLKVLREHAKASTASKPYMGVGNPLLTGEDGKDVRAFAKQTCPDASPVTPQKVAARSGLNRDAVQFFRGGLGDVKRLREQNPLPDSADELCDVGRSLGASDADILLGAKATEDNVKSLNATGALANYRVLHFATHGLLPAETAGLSSGLVEPALLLTPPDIATKNDDALLTASEIAQFKLNADWVILSACNTAGADKVGAESLSGLARAFFYAGARALLVSHWYVDDLSAVDLVKKAFAELKRDPKMGRAEAMRRSMQALIARGGSSAHPANWAPFVVVGEGGAL